MKSVLLVITMLLAVPTAALADLDLPVQGVITSGVGWRTDPFGTGKLAFHRGIDIAVPVGTPVRATRQGKVVFSGERRGYGATVIVEHANGDRTLFGHNSLVKVHEGDLVEPGTVLALSGNTGRSTGPHVHFEQIPSGRRVSEQVAAAEPAEPVQSKLDEQRNMLEQKMEQSLDAILKRIRSGIAGPTGQGG